MKTKLLFCISKAGVVVAVEGFTSVVVAEGVVVVAVVVCE